MSCQRLSTVHGLAPEKLIKLAFKFLPYRTLQAVFATLHPAQHRILMQQRRRGVSLHHLADTLYYHQGATLSRLSRWNEMTVLQMQHELLKREQLDEGEEKSLSEWGLRIRLVCLMVEERRAWKEGKEQRRVDEEEDRRAWIAQCRAYEEEDEGEPMDIAVAASQEGGQVMFTSLIAEINGVEPSFKKNTTQVKSATARRRTVAETTLTSAPPLRQRTVPRHPQQHQAIDRYMAVAHNPWREPKRLAISSYEVMKQQELLEEAQIRGLEIDNGGKTHLVNILIIDDEAYAKLMGVLGCRFRAADFAQGEVKLYNQEVKRKRAEAEAKQQQAIREMHKKAKRDARVKAEKLVWEKKQAENKAAKAKEQEQRKRKRSDKIDSGCSSAPKKTKSTRAPPVRPGPRKTGTNKASSGDRKLVKMSVANDMKDAHDDDEDEDGLGDFIVDDLPQKPKRKSDVGGMARSRLIAGF
ncbi:hypothetical protein J4E85_009902 [Alternaria conjuncta]|uniref:uncharacterized protein n=1 Tax=Alternaria conjuncta TaxID=181017 RepID=UPI00221F6C5D|nr:uncharacterized protein J4E85_009902 [Alternaria conjuncta]KAI4917810.1 hypothetical protein J4E85_009902 [Alternaria conjuncta]